MIRRLSTIIGIIAIIFIMYGIYRISTFEIFDDEIIELENIKILNKNYCIIIYQIPSNATIQSSIQIRKLENEIEEVLYDFERFNQLDSFTLKNDTLSVRISDIDKVLNPKCIQIKLP